MVKVSTFGYSDNGGRLKNEDSGGIYFYGKNLVAIIADGLGGQGDGDVASSTAVGCLSQCGITGKMPDSNSLRLWLENANDAITRKQQNKTQMKTTVVYLCIHENQAIWAHVGDSRLYHFFNETIVDYTLDHSVPQLAVLMGEISREEIPFHPQRSQLFRALGVDDFQADVNEPVDLLPGKHAFLLCTDGFWEYIKEPEMEEALRCAETAQQWVISLRELVNDRCEADHDNNTAMGIVMEV